MFNNNSDFFPTPKSLVNKMLQSIDFRLINSVLEPSGGKGDLLEGVKDKFKYSRYSSYNSQKEANYDIDTIELDENLRHVLKGKGYRVVHNDFLTYNSLKSYDLIVMNPPFSEGDKHLLKAIELQQNGGKIVCLLNAETLKYPYSNIRKDLINKLNNYNADIEYIQNAFIDAERKTKIEIALIKINIPKVEYNSTILTALKQEEQHREEATYNSNQVINADFLKGIVEQYNFELKAGLKLIAEYKAMQPLLINSLKNDSWKNSILKLELHYEDRENTLENGYIRQIRGKYWETLFEAPQFMGLFTSNLRQQYNEKVNQLKDYDFSLYNIYTIRAELSKEMIKAVEETIINLFEEFSHKHHYTELSNNIHYYNGWKTNQAYKINKKIIIPLNSYGYFGDRLTYNYKVKDKLSDIEKVFNYLDDGTTEEIFLEDALKLAEDERKTKKIELKYFYITFYKKGTCHIEFKNMDLLHKFNLFGSQRKGWLPPSYGKKSYRKMTEEEKQVINEFEGEESYKKVIHNRDYFITESSNLLRLTTSA